MTPRRFKRLSDILDRRQPDLTLLLDDLQKPHNVSAVIRTCDAVGIHEIHGLSDSEQFATKRTSAAGSGRYVGMRVHTSPQTAIDWLSDQGFELLAAELRPGSVDFRTVDYTKPVCIVLGQEGPGIRSELAAASQRSISIPIVGAVESLNVSVAAAVILFEAQRQRAAAGLYDTPHLDHAERQRLLFEWGYKRLARWCRERGHPYPRLGDAGEILDPLPR